MNCGKHVLTFGFRWLLLGSGSELDGPWRYENIGLTCVNPSVSNADGVFSVWARPASKMS